MERRVRRRGNQGLTPAEEREAYVILAFIRSITGRLRVLKEWAFLCTRYGQGHYVLMTGRWFLMLDYIDEVCP